MIILLLISYFFGSSELGKQISPAWIVLVVTFGILWYLRKRQAHKKRLNGLKELPGPKGWPILGNALERGSFPNRQMTKWREQFGDIYKVKLGNLNTVVVSDPKMVKEIFTNEPAFTGRLQFPYFDMYQDVPELGIFAAEGERWEVHRRFLLRQLRDFGFGKSSMESLIFDEVNEVIERYKRMAGKPVGKIRETLRLAVVNSLWVILSSQRFDHDDPKLLRLASYTSDKFNEVIEKGGILFVLPWLRHIFPEWTSFRSIREMIDENKVFFEKSVDDHISNFKEGETLKDFIDVYLNEMKKHEHDPKSPFYGEVAKKHLATELFDLFFAGNDTTATTITWAILYLCKFPLVQEKLQKEIEEVTTGNLRRVSVNDRSNMPYAVALIDEILRFSSIAPDGGPHRAMADKEFRGYHIAKDSVIQANLRYIHFNPKLWEDPEIFRPERFLTEEGKYKRNENLMAFSVGKRQCAGETLARDETFLFVTSLFQQFKMVFDPDMEKEPNFDALPGFIEAPLPYSIVMTERLNGKL